MGHQVYGMHRGDGSFGIDSVYCTEDFPDTGCGYDTGISSDNEHALHSLERSSCAMGEGFAQFFATDVFNNHSQGQAIFAYHKPGFPTVVDVENGPTGGNTKFMATTCGDPTPSDPYGGLGVELDWQRMFWDYHTPNNSNTPNHREILDQIQAAHDHPSFGSRHAYLKLYEAAIDDDYGDRFDDTAKWNGINYTYDP